MNRLLISLMLLVSFSVVLSAGGTREPDSLLISTKRLETMMTDQRPVILDVRDASSYAAGHIPGALLMLPDDIDRIGSEYVATGRPIVTYCACPAEESSLAAAIRLRDLGATKVFVLQGGIRAWVREGRSTVTGSHPG